MNLTALGVSNALYTNGFSSNFLIEFESGYKLLFDCGADIKCSLNNLDIHPLDIDGVYISHLHSDHVGGLEYLAFSKYFLGGMKRVDLFIDPYYREELWSETLKGGMKYINGKKCNINTFFNVKELISGRFVLEFCNPEEYRVSMQPVKVPHYKIDSEIIPSFGLLIQEQSAEQNAVRSIFISSDTQYCPEILNLLINADVDAILHDCEMGTVRSKVHAHYNDLRNLPEELKKKMWLYHYDNESYLRRESSHLSFAKRDGFAGVMKIGQELVFGIQNG
jgi:ribonuclease BN (tRNA processing enzyme)